ncbi:NADH-quinone oxidoreductase subunit J [Acidianus sulfidivorans JP7]|uniref:NADH-quinone oxidoreductase subunit J n=1 Tax=Acidianus sulfidivorans JP7 TaxID=619593 RepID=A0A2U9INS8_9CREN|nr:NADH-quinone oxidoreductase subunit J [Acidianus sulfidivorans]AWR97624.1 NADH-quinone oxidoreductase subunit J [Acidianus sulfidivorans JP7]
MNLSLDLILFLFFSIISISSAIFIVTSKNVFYAAVTLAFLGISIAVLIALIAPNSYSIYSAFHLLLYVGATVVFLSVSLVMFRGLNVKQINVPWASFLAIIATGAIFVVVVLSLTTIKVSLPSSLNLQELANTILSQYWFPAIVLVIGLLTTLIEAITLARRD